jgi:hypothetical protein
MFSATSGSYVATVTATIAPDGQSMSGTGTDTNGTAATFTFPRTAAAVPSSGPAGSPSPAAGCTFGGSGGDTRPFPTSASDPGIVRVVPDSLAGQVLFPDALAIDTGDPRGRVFVSNVQSRTISVIAGRPLAPGDIGIETTFQVGGLNVATAVDAATGRVFIADEAQCQVEVVNGRASPPALIQTINLPGNPDDLEFDPSSGRLFVTLSVAGEVLAFQPDLTASPTIIPVPGGPQRLVIDGGRGFVYVASTTVAVAGAAAAGAITTIDDRAGTPKVTGQVAAATPTAMAVDPTSHAVFVAELGTGEVTSFAATPDGVLTRGASVPVDPDPSARTVAAMVVLPGSREVLVPLATATRANLFTIGSDGSLSLVRSIAGISGGVAAALDPATGRVFVAELRNSAVAVVALDVAVEAPPSLAAALPGPLDISLAPQDVARSVGIVAFLMLLLGAPSPLFNSTLSAKRRLIERWLRRKVPRSLRGAGSASGVSRILVAISRTWPGFAVYLVLVAVVYAFLDPGFPGSNAGLVLGMTLFGIAVGTAVSQIPAELYVRRRYRHRGQIRLALWTLVLAAACVALTRLSGVQPGYVYGIIGGFTFSVALTAEDHGRMAFRGMGVLLAVGFAAWFLRIPFQPSVGLIGGDAGNVGNSVLAALFVSAVQGAAIGLIPLRFLTGESLFAWSRRRWAILWALALLLFAHVILYPVSSFEPTPSPTGLWTVALVVVVYGTVAVGFWGFFARRDRRRQQRLRAAVVTSEP